MASLSCHFNSAALDLKTQIEILIPDDIKEDEKLKVLYLLHGYYGNQTDWIRQSSIERYISKYRVVVVMPAVNNSYYTNMVYGLKYFTYVTEDLPKFIENTFPVSKHRDDHYICGLSMGGYGALKIAFTYPTRYKMAASISGALNLEHIKSLSLTNGKRLQFEATFGYKSVKDTKHDLKYLVSQMSKKDKESLNLFIGCGKEDFLYQDNVDFVSYLKEQEIACTYVESSGTHDWVFWDSSVQKVIKWMFD